MYKMTPQSSYITDYMQMMNLGLINNENNAFKNFWLATRIISIKQVTTTTNNYSIGCYYMSSYIEPTILWEFDGQNDNEVPTQSESTHQVCPVIKIKYMST